MKNNIKLLGQILIPYECINTHTLYQITFQVDRTLYMCILKFNIETFNNTTFYENNIYIYNNQTIYRESFWCKLDIEEVSIDIKQEIIYMQTEQIYTYHIVNGD